MTGACLNIKIETLKTRGLSSIRTKIRAHEVTYDALERAVLVHGCKIFSFTPKKRN